MDEENTVDEGESFDRNAHIEQLEETIRQLEEQVEQLENEVYNLERDHEQAYDDYLDSEDKLGEALEALRRIGAIADEYGS